MPFALLPLFILLLPIVEIAGFIYVGQAIGLWQTLGLVILAGIIGMGVLRFAGMASIRRINDDLRAGRGPEGRIADSLFIAIAGLLLIIPGFVTDVIGLLLLLPPVRMGLRALLRRHVKVKTSFSSTGFRRPDQRGKNDGGDYFDLSPEDFSRTDDGPDRTRLPRQD